MPRSKKKRLRVGTQIIEIEIPGRALYGAETALAHQNYQTVGQRTPFALISALALIKKAAALTHRDLGALEPHIALAVAQASDEVMEGKWNKEFPLDALNSGAGTSLHMNVNEVLANRATQILRRKGMLKIRVDPHNHLNIGQSTNDVMPTAMRIACTREVRALLEQTVLLREALKDKAHKLWHIKTAGRTHMQDALPIALGQRFLSYAERIEATIKILNTARLELATLRIGGSAVGTGANVVPGYQKHMIEHISRLTCTAFCKSSNVYGSTNFLTDFSQLASALRMLAIELQTISEDLELASSGPNAGIGELILPAVQPGSSIMPGKVNPSILENLSMACILVQGNSTIVEEVNLKTRLELNSRMPLMAWKLLESLGILQRGIEMFRTKCLEGIEANKKRCRHYYEQAAWLTLLNPHLGYDEAAELTAQVRQESEGTGETVLQILLRIAKERDIRLSDGSPITEKVLERLAFPKFH